MGAFAALWRPWWASGGVCVFDGAGPAMTWPAPERGSALLVPHRTRYSTWLSWDGYLFDDLAEGLRFVRVSDTGRAARFWFRRVDEARDDITVAVSQLLDAGITPMEVREHLADAIRAWRRNVSRDARG